MSVLLLCRFLLSGEAVEGAAIYLSEEDAGRIGERIFSNECSGKPENLVAWNEGEDFMSLGIGHFIWYPQGRRGPFGESFPELLSYLRQKGAEAPAWLYHNGRLRCPWRSREEFLREPRYGKIAGLIKFLSDTKALQLEFIVERLNRALPKMLDAAPYGKRKNVERQFYRVASTPNGIYALVDYVNFKGEGIEASERYAGEGWGLFQVLESMSGTEDGVAAVQEFVEKAKLALRQRVENSPAERGEKRWLPGWENRLDTYLI